MSDRLSDIVLEVMDLIDAPDIIRFLQGEANSGNMQALDARLQDIMMTRQSFETIELAMYLRTSSNWSTHLPTWQPLLNASIEMGKMRGEQVDDIFYGMIGHRASPQRNTGYAV